MKLNKLVSTLNMEHSTWLKYRRKGVGGSDAGSPDAMAFMKHLAELYKTTGNNSFDFIEYMSVPNHSAALEELMAKGYVSWKDDFQNILGTITINLDVLKEED